MKRIVHLLTFALLFLMVACEQTIETEDLNLPESNMNGEWIVNAYMDNNQVFGPFIISTQMTLKNESLYIKDNGTFWNFQTEAGAIYSSDTFKTESSVNEKSNVEANIRILNGSVINKDSITFEIQFEDDETPYGITYIIKGYRN